MGEVLEIALIAFASGFILGLMITTWIVYGEGGPWEQGFADGWKASSDMPESDESELVGYKKAWVDTSRTHSALVELDIPKTAIIVKGPCNMYRCNKAKVRSIIDLDATKEISQAVSNFDKTFIYKVGKNVASSGQIDKNNETCSGAGIHFFMSKEEALRYRI